MILNSPQHRHVLDENARKAGNRIEHTIERLEDWRRYPSDLADEEWAIIAPLIPRAKRGGNKRMIESARWSMG